ncbi:MAG: hypothetical protein A3F83_14970 [Candidatus Glassbacteria bacterium RIFCSPLOWO2_12_FULL_58_11]|uniref:Cellulase Ig-like domain-containing protein n=1 Tax=Candidatus Glassbacteria bacterium RIFCSPLOWO2_12_FULL_58_11 TaxID=1817867 RepID=A0A1F5YYY6_9BACT|nr:MAG: hypothetical protein A3F83_14970 [Candidatus Glassbacteria bacterium RIFCSPLOWO2_12_FULL_58_11]
MLFVSLPALSSGSAGAALDLPLTAREYGGYARRSEVATLGVPLPRGAVPDPERLAVLDPAGRPVLSQFETTAVWPDGSVRWVLIDFSADCPAGGSAVYRLRDNGARPADLPVLNVSEDSLGVTVETGLLRCRLERRYFDLFSAVYLDHNRDGAFTEDERVTSRNNSPGVRALDALGRELSSRWGSARSFEVEAAGPLRATVAVKGSLYEYESFQRGEPWIDYTARLHFYAGSGLVRVFFSLENHNSTLPLKDEDGDRSHWVLGRPGSFYFEDLSLETRLAFEGPVQLSVGDSAAEILDRLVLTSRGGVYQESSGGENWFSRNHMNHLGIIPLTFRGARFFLDGTVAAERDRPKAWLQVCDRKYGLAVAVRHFWQNFPKCLSADPDGTVRVALWPEEFPDRHELEGGEIKTHEVAFLFHTGPQGSSPAENRIATALGAFQHPLYVRAPAAWYLAGGFFDDAATFDPQRFPTYENLMSGALNNPDNNLIRDIETIDEYGWRNFGDTWAKNEIDQTAGPNTGRIVLSHYNNEYDYGYGMLFQSLRTVDGDPRTSFKWWEMAAAANLHQSDIDLYHAKDSANQGGVYSGGKFTHTQHGVEAALAGHRGGPRLAWSGSLRWPWGQGSNPESGHFDNRGMLAYYYLTGDRRVLESANEIRDLVYWKITENRFPQIEQTNRDAGNNLQILTDAWLNTWDDKYRLAAEKILLTTHPDSQWYTSEQGRQANPDKAVSGFWSAAICIDAAARFTRTAEEKDGKPYRPGRDYVIKYADFMAAFLAAGPEIGFFSEWSPARGGGKRGYGPWTYRLSDIVMYGYRYSADPALKRRCLKAAVDAFACMRRQYPGPGPIYTDSKANTMLTGGGHEYTSYLQNGSLPE